MTSAGAMRWLSVTLPSLFGHTMTIGEFGICAPKPIAIQPRLLEPVEESVYWVVALGKTTAAMHMSCTHLESPVSPLEEFVARVWGASAGAGCGVSKTGLTWMVEALAAPRASAAVRRERNMAVERGEWGEVYRTAALCTPGVACDGN